MEFAAVDWLEDWQKFAPGWFAFVIALGAIGRKALTRWHLLALGPDDDKLRTALTTTRGLFEEITSESGKTASWFMDGERRETARGIRDLAERRKDRVIKRALASIAASWDEVSVWSVPDRPLIHWEGRERTPQERAELESDLERGRRQVEEAHRGWQHVERAISRLNELERRVHGRS